MCPTGDDPLTACTSTNNKNIQEVRFRLGSKVAHNPTIGGAATYTASSAEMDLFGTSGLATFGAVRSGAYGMRLTFTDVHGGKFVAHAATNMLTLDAEPNAARDSLELALETLPEAKVHDVVVGTKMTSTAADGGLDNVIERRYLVTFQADAVTSNVMGLQNALTCDSGYSCTEAGCQPMVTMPFLYRYGGMLAADAVAAPSPITVGSGNIAFFTGNRNTIANSAAGNVLRLHPDSQPQMPLGIAVDSGVSASSLARYDMRILVAVVDPVDGTDTPVDVYYTRVIVGHDNITSTQEMVGSDVTGPWAPAGTFTPTLNGFTFNGPIPLNAAGTAVSDKVSVPGAPGVYLSFDNVLGRNYVTADGYGRWYEILIKLPTCSVQVATAANPVKELGFASNVATIDENVENIECSGRGLCNYNAGTCACFAGFSGVACQTQSALV